LNTDNCSPSRAILSAAILSPSLMGRFIFLACFAKYLECIERPRNRLGLNEEYIADFELIARRTLTDPAERGLFTRHFVFCDTINRGDLPRIRAIQEKVGQAFAETEPFPLYPIDTYFERVRR
jgi:hypothetical protein